MQDNLVCQKNVRQRIPVCKPLLNPKAKDLLAQCIDEGWISSEGKFVKKFESSFADMVMRSHAVAVCNGSAALIAAVRALGIGAGDEVIVPSFAIISCAAAVVANGATCIFVDCDRAHWNATVEQIEQAITPRTKAIMAVHTYGFPVDMEPVLALAKARNILVIEDAAEAHTLQYKGKPCGSFGDISTFSFYANKFVTCGEGGMILTNDESVADKLKLLRNLNFDPKDRFHHEELSWNFRMGNLQAALGIAQMEVCHEIAARKKKIAARYRRNLSGNADITLPVEETADAANCYWVFGILVESLDGARIRKIVAELAECGIEMRRFFKPMHLQPAMHSLGQGLDAHCPNAEFIRDHGLIFPGGPMIEDEEIDYVCEVFLDILRR